MTDAPSPAWPRALRALALLAVDPTGLGGITLRARAGPVRQSLERALEQVPLTQRRLHPDVSDIQLFGGTDIAATLAQGRLVRDPGLADTPALLILPMAERTTPGLAARLGAILDCGRGHALVLLDEGIDNDEHAPGTLGDRLAFHVDLHDTRWLEARVSLPAPGDLDPARKRLRHVASSGNDAAALTALAARFGIDSPRAPLLALRTARAIAALDGHDHVTDTALREAAELVYPSRATMLPQTDDDPPQPADQDTTPDDAPPDQDQSSPDALPDDIMVEAVRALLPPSLLDQIADARSGPRGASGTGAGARRRGNRRGRPLPARPGRPDSHARIDVVATLRAAVPWQRLRRAHHPGAPQRVIIHPGDIRLRRYEDRSDRLLIFTVDASGSAAMARLAEAKGAVELLLAQAYARRDQVALVAFRGAGAEVLLPPTRSLVQAKRRLAGMPGGGGTPLAAGLVAASVLAEQARGRGLSPALALLTDGRANVALDGAGDRARAMEDTAQTARHCLSQNIPGVVIDTATRPGDAPATLAAQLGARYLALPRADAQGISSAVTAALDG